MKTPDTHINPAASGRMKPRLFESLRLASATALVAFATLTPAMADYESTVQLFSPPGYWRLNETAPSAEDTTAYNTGSGSGINGAYVNFPTKGVTGAIVGDSNTAASFSNIAPKEKMLIPYSAALNPSGSFSAEVWVKPTSVTNGLQTVFCSGQFASSGRSGWLIYQNNTTWNLRMYTGTGLGTSVNLSFGTAAVGVWSHLVLVFDAGANTATLYVDGVASTAATPSPAFVAGASGGTAIAGRADTADFDNACWADEMAIYSTALSAARVTAHYENGIDTPSRSQAYHLEVAADSPVGYYRLDEAVFVAPTADNIGTLDSLADGPYGTGTTNNQTGPTASGLGGGNVACKFNGSGQINCGADVGLDVTQISVATWIKTSSVVPNMTVIAKGAGLWRLQLGSSNNLKWICPDGDVTGTANVADGLWHYVVAVSGIDGSALYVDGVLDGSNATSVTTIAANTDPLTIGGMNGSAYWFGSIDEPVVFGSALTAADAENLYLASEPPANDIYSFGPGATISGTDITWKVPAGSIITSLSPTYTLSYQATCDLASGSTQDFTNPVVYTVNGTKAYTVTVEEAVLPVIDGLACWYDASEGITTDGTGVLTWNDQSGNGHHATRLSGAPSLAVDDVNSRDAVHFRSTNGIFDCAEPMFVKELWVVVRSPNPTWTGSLSFLGRKSSDFLSVRSSSHNIANGTTGFWQDHYPLTVVKNGNEPAPYPSVVNSNGSQNNAGVFQNGCKFAIDDITQYMILRIVVDDDATPLNRAQYPFYQIGQNETIGSGEFDVAEIIGYDSTTSSLEQQSLGAYLSVKYGLNTLYVPSDYATWANGYLPDDVSDPALDFDNDGLTNHQEYAFGLDPTSGASVSPITQQLDKGTGIFKYKRRATPVETGLTYIYEWSTTLVGAWGTFTPVTDPPASDSGTPVEEITIEVPAAQLANPTLFVRVRAD